MKQTDLYGRIDKYRLTKEDSTLDVESTVVCCYGISQFGV